MYWFWDILQMWLQWFWRCAQDKEDGEVSSKMQCFNQLSFFFYFLILNQFWRLQTITKGGGWRLAVFLKCSPDGCVSSSLVPWGMRAFCFRGYLWKNKYKKMKGSYISKSRGIFSKCPNKLIMLQKYIQIVCVHTQDKNILWL